MTPQALDESLSESVDESGHPSEAWAAQARRLHAAIADCAGSPAGALLAAGLQALVDGGAPDRASELARKALVEDPNCAPGWRLLALSLEGRGLFVDSIGAYERSLALDPGSADILADLGRVALALDLDDLAVQFFGSARAADPGSTDLSEQLARALRKSHRYDLAVQVLDEALRRRSGDAQLWNALGSVHLQEGDMEAALQAFERALALKPDQVEGLYNRASARLELGDFAGAQVDCDRALARASPDQAPAVRFVRGLARLSNGELAGGWADYEARFDPRFSGAAAYPIPLRRWTPGAGLADAQLLVVGEQGLGDEMMFAGLIPDAAAAVGPKGRLGLAVSPRLVPLFARSFPGVEVCAHASEVERGHRSRRVPDPPAGLDLWTPMGSLAASLRREIGDFDAAAAPILTAYLVRAKAWRKELDALGPEPKVGIVWKSLKTYGDRRRQFAPFEAWGPVLTTPGVRFVNLQYGDCGAELEQARALGVEIWSAPGLDLTNDLDGAAALSVGVDLVVGFSTASTNVAAACGARTWIVAPAACWWRHGTERHPWFPRARVVFAERGEAWEAAMARVGESLRAEFADLDTKVIA